MTDRYLFRGFHPCENGTESVWIEGEEIKGRWIESNCIVQDPKLKLLFDKVKLFDWEKENWFEVLPETVGQYTLLEDKNGNKVFENDILEDKETDFIVYFDKDFAAFFLKDKYNPYYTEASVNSTIKTMSIVGSTHSNPELLNKGE